MSTERIRYNELVEELVELMTAKVLARRIGVEDREIRRWKQGTHCPQGDSAEKLLRECEERGINWRTYQQPIPVYDYRKTYDENMRNGPQGLSPSHNPCLLPIKTKFLGYNLNSPIGLSASVLTANSSWIGVLARYGYDIITFKTIGTPARKPHAFPNWVPLPGLREAQPIGMFPESVLGDPELPDGTLSASVGWGNSFGLPRPGIEVSVTELIRSKELLSGGQILVASIVGDDDTPGEDLVDNTVRCGRLVAEAKPHAIEVNLSCPNVYGREGSLCLDPRTAGIICQRLNAELKDIPLLVKVAYMPRDPLAAFFTAVYKHVRGFTAINTIPATIMGDGQSPEPLFSGRRARAGVSGIAIREYANESARLLRELSTKYRKDLEIVGVGGISTVADVKTRLETGANVVQLCTAVNLNPHIGVQIRKQLTSSKSNIFTAKVFGHMASFRTRGELEAFKNLSEVCEDLEYPWPDGVKVLEHNWLDQYYRDRDRLGPAGSAIGTPPEKRDIEKWIRNAAANVKKR